MEELNQTKVEHIIKPVRASNVPQTPVLNKKTPTTTVSLYDFILHHLELNDIDGFEWIDETAFKVPWRHKAKACFEVSRDFHLFHLYEQEVRDCIPEEYTIEQMNKVKARFRVALNKSKYFKCLEGRVASAKSGQEQFKVYKVLKQHDDKTSFGDDSWSLTNTSYSSIVANPLENQTEEISIDSTMDDFSEDMNLTKITDQRMTNTSFSLLQNVDTIYGAKEDCPHLNNRNMDSDYFKWNDKSSSLLCDMDDFELFPALNDI